MRAIAVVLREEQLELCRNGLRTLPVLLRAGVVIGQVTGRLTPSNAKLTLRVYPSRVGVKIISP